MIVSIGGDSSGNSNSLEALLDCRLERTLVVVDVYSKNWMIILFFTLITVFQREFAQRRFANYVS